MNRNNFAFSTVNGELMKINIASCLPLLLAFLSQLSSFRHHNFWLLITTRKVSLLNKRKLLRQLLLVKRQNLHEKYDPHKKQRHCVCYEIIYLLFASLSMALQESSSSCDLRERKMMSWVNIEGEVLLLQNIA